MCVLQAVCRAYISTGFNYLKGAETCTLEVNAVRPCIMALDFLLVTKKGALFAVLDIEESVIICLCLTYL